MATSYQQSQIIESINKYLEYHNLPAVCRLDSQGICNGLATLFARYVLEKKEDEFLAVLQYMSEKKYDDAWDENVNRFVIEVLKFASPRLFSHAIGQTGTYREMLIEGRNVSAAFRLGLVTNAKNWATIFADLHLENGEVMLVKSPRHSISITRNIEGEYIVYDPNYSSGIKRFKQEKELLSELKDNVFEFDNDNVGLGIRILRTPKSPRKKYPKVQAIYNTYLVPPADPVATKSGSSWHTLNFAADLFSKKAIKKLLQLNAVGGLDQATLQLINENQTDLLSLLLEKAAPDQKFVYLLYSARMGKLESFHCILNCVPVTVDELHKFLDQAYFKRLLDFAAQGGNTLILKEIIDVIIAPQGNLNVSGGSNEAQIIPADTLKTLIFETDKNNKDTIMQAIQSPTAAGLILLLNALDDNGLLLSTQQQLDYLSLAIEENNPIMVETLLMHGKNAIPNSLLQTQQLTHDVIKKTDLYLLKSLKQHGMHFSKVGETMMKQKEHHGLLLTIGIILMKFMDWIKHIRNKHPTTHHTNLRLLFSPSAENSESEKKITTSSTAPSTNR